MIAFLLGLSVCLFVCQADCFLYDSLPFYVVLGFLHDQVDSLKHVRDVIDPTLLNIQQL